MAALQEVDRVLLLDEGRIVHIGEAGTLSAAGHTDAGHTDAGHTDVDRTHDGALR
jgi:hypothetical protein